MDNNELMHHGVKGMKWGVRKKRKPTNPLGAYILKAKKKKSEKNVPTPVSPPKKKTIKDMSDDELKKAITRLEMEKRYKDLTPKQIPKGKQFVNDIVNKAVIPAVTEASKNLAKDYITKVGKKKLGLDIKESDQAYIDRLSKEVKKMTLEKSYKNLKKELGLGD